MEFLKDFADLAISAASALIALAALFFARRADARSIRAEAINQLLGENETVGFAAIKLLTNGLPRAKHERSLVLLAALQACIFESSDRARALLYRVIEDNMHKHGSEIRYALGVVQETYSRMDKHRFKKEQLDLTSGRNRLEALEKLIGPPQGGAYQFVQTEPASRLGLS